MLHLGRLFICILLLAGSVFGQAAAGNESFSQKRYADAANAYERIPAAQRDAGIYNRLGISYHLTNQFKAAEGMTNIRDSFMFRLIQLSSYSTVEQEKIQQWDK